MKSSKFFKIIRRFLVLPALTLGIASVGGCSYIANSIMNMVAEKQQISDYRSETEIDAESLMAVRSSIRAFNISIDTQYYQSTGWFSRSAGTGLGSGVVFDEDDTYYYALTNNHVITNVVDGHTYKVAYTVTDINGTEYSDSDVSVVMKDSTQDIAIIQFRKQTSAEALTLADCTARADTNVSPGELVFAVGNPSGVNNIVTYGEVIGWAAIGNVDYKVIHHNALINPGNSGGALCDIDGNLLGLNTWGSSDDNTDDDNYSIPLSIINDYIESFRQSTSSAA